MPDCSKCLESIPDGAKFARVRENREERSMDVQHDRCCEDSSAQRRTMSPKYAKQIDSY
jgi:hypothetical protein